MPQPAYRPPLIGKPRLHLKHITYKTSLTVITVLLWPTDITLVVAGYASWCLGVGRGKGIIGWEWQVWLGLLMIVTQSWVRGLKSAELHTRRWLLPAPRNEYQHPRTWQQKKYFKNSVLAKIISSIFSILRKQMTLSDQFIINVNFH